MDESGEITDELHQFLYEKPVVKVVFSVRADRLSLLNSLTDRHPTILQNYYELNALNRTQAEQAIANPARAPQSHGFLTPAFDFTKEAIHKILDGVGNVQDGKIETSTLQIVCRYVEDELVKGRGIQTITGDLLGDIAQIFREYYEGVLARLDIKDRLKAQHLIEDELIEEGRRNTLTDGYIRNRFGFSERLLAQLEQSSLLRKERDAAGRILYEISHDTLVGPIEMVAMGRRQVEEEQKRESLEASLAEEQRRAKFLSELNAKVVARSRLAIALAVGSLLIAAVAVYFWYDSRKAERTAKDSLFSLFRMNYQQACAYESYARVFIKSEDDSLALQDILAADSLLHTVRFTLPDPERHQQDSLKTLLDSEARVCRSALKK